MPTYRRAFVEEASYFFRVVTFARLPILTTDEGRALRRGSVGRVEDWQWSSFHRYVRVGYYEQDWGGTVDEEMKGMRCGV
jgi:hypothetical protein